MNKIYLYRHQFEEVNEEDEDVDKVYDKTSNKLSIVCTKLFAEDEIGSLPEEIHNGWTQEDKQDDSKLYSRELCFERFRFNQDKLNIEAGYVDEDRKFNLDEEPFGKQLWGIGYISSDWQEDRDNEEYLEDEDDLFEEATLI